MHPHVNEVIHHEEPHIEEHHHVDVHHDTPHHLEHHHEDPHHHIEEVHHEVPHHHIEEIHHDVPHHHTEEIHHGEHHQTYPNFYIQGFGGVTIPVIQAEIGMGASLIVEGLGFGPRNHPILPPAVANVVS